MAQIINWPCSLGLRETDFFLRWTTRSAGRSLAGHEQIIGVNSAVWEVTLTLARSFDQTQVKTFEALVARMRGRQNIANLCICDPYRYSARVSPLQTPFSDGTWFDDGTGFAEPISAGTQPLVVTTGGAVGATQIFVGLTVPTRSNLRIGDMFSLNGFLYRVVDSGAAGRVDFEPPLRQAIPVGATLVVNPPRFFGRFATDDEGRRPREMLKWGREVSITFVEAFDR